MLATFFIFLSVAIFFGQYFLDGRRIDIFEPKTLFLLYFIIQLPLVLVIGTRFDLPGFLLLSSNTSDYDILKLGSIFLVAQITMIVSYYAVGKKWLSFPIVGRIKWIYKQVIFSCVFLFIIGYTAFFYLLYTNGGYENFVENREIWRSGGMTGQGWLIFPSTTMLSMTAIAYMIVCKERFRQAKGIFRLFLLVVLTIFPASQMGFRGLMLLPLLQILFVYHYKIQRLKVRQVVPVFLLLIFLFTAYGIYRESLFLMKDGFNFSIALNFASDHPEFIFAIFSRSKGADIVAAVIDQMDSVSSYVLFIPAAIEAMTIFIPSFLWADKPTPLSIKFSEKFFGISGGVSPTVVGEAYWHGGLCGILIVMVLLGSLFRLYKNSIRNSNGDDSSFFILTSIFPSLVMMAEAIQGNLNGIVLIILCGVMMVYLFSLKL